MSGELVANSTCPAARGGACTCTWDDWDDCCASPKQGPCGFCHACGDGCECPPASTDSEKGPATDG